MSNLPLSPQDISPLVDMFRSFLAIRRLSSEEISIYSTALYGFLSEIAATQSLTLEDLSTLPQEQLAAYGQSIGLDNSQIEELFSLWKNHLASRQASTDHGSVFPPEIPNYRPTPSRDQLVKKYALALEASNRSTSTIKNYVGDLRAFFDFFGENDLRNFLTKPNVTLFVEHLKNSGLSDTSIERKVTSLRQFFAWALSKGYIASNPLELESVPEERLLGTTRESSAGPVVFLPIPISSLLKAIGETRFGTSVKRTYTAYHKFRFTSYLHLALLLVFTTLLTFGGFRQFILNVNQSNAFPTTLTRPNRILSFQARLTDSSSQPITTPTGLSFRLYTSDTGGVSLWTGSCTVTPDQDGIFSTLLGDTCGSEIPSSVFTENAEVWLEVSVGAETLTPRQRIATVAYALNSETLQGYPPADPAQINTIPVVNNAGAIVIAAASPTLQSTSGTFAVKANALSITTNTGTGGNITIAPDGTGQVQVIGGTTTTNTFTVSNANLSTGALINGTVGNNNTGFKLLELSAGSTPTEKFSVDALGNVVAKGYLSAPGATLSANYSGATPLIIQGTGGQIFSISNAGNVTLANGANIQPLSDGTSALNIANSSGTAFVTFDTTNSEVEISSLGTAGAIIYSVDGAGTLNETSQGVVGQCLVSGGAGSPTWGTCGSASGGTLWKIVNGGISPINDTVDLLIGSAATSSAKFAVINVNGPRGSQTASISGNITLDAAGSIQTTNNQALTIGGDATGNITISPLNGAGTTLNTGTFNLSAGKTYQIGGVDVLSSTTLGGTVVNSSLTSVGALSSGSITTGFGTITTTNTITGTTINGTTGINTGAGAGTQRIDASGNLVNINNITAGGTVTFNGLGTGVVHATGGILSTSAVDLTTEVTGVLPIANGGTNGTATPTAGAIAYGTGTAYAFSAVGSSGQCLVSGGAGSPTWSSCSSASSNFWQLNGEVLSPINSTWDLAVGGTSTASALFKVEGLTGNATMAGTLTVSTIRPPTGPLTLQYKSGPNSWADAVTIQPTTGNVGIGTNNPSSDLLHLETAGATGLYINTTSGTADPYIELHGSGVARGSEGTKITYDNDTGNTYYDTLFTNGGSIFRTGGRTTSTLTLTGDGYVEINHTGVPILRFKENDSTKWGLISGLSGANDFSFYDYSTGTHKLVIQDGSGNVGIGTTSPIAPLHVSQGYGGNAATIINQLNAGDIFTASSSGTTRFVIGNTGTLTFNSYQSCTSLTTTAAGTVVCGTNAGANINYWQLNDEVISPGISSRDLAVGGTSTASALFQVFGDTGNVTTDGTITSTTLNTPGGIIYAQSGGTLGVSAAGTLGQCLVSGGSGTPTWTSCSSAASNYWQLNGEVLSPSNSTWDLAVGGTSTASALFQVQALTGNATMAGTLTVSTIRPPTGPLTLQYKSGPNSWADAVTIQPTTGFVGIGTTNPTNKLTVDGSNALFHNLTGGGQFDFTIRGGEADSAVFTLAADDADNSTDITIFTQADGGPLTINPTNGTVTGIALTATGNVGVGIAAPIARLQSNSITSADEEIFRGSFGGSSVLLLNGRGELTLTSPTGGSAASSGRGRFEISGNYNLNTNGLMFGGENITVTNNSSAGDSLFYGLRVAPVINQSGTATGNYTALLVNPTQTSFLGTIGRIADFQIGSVSKMVITNTGLIGIGTTSPLSTLDVRGVATISGTNASANLIVDQSGTGDIFTASASGATRFVIGNNGTLTFNSYQNCTGLTTTAGGVVTCNTNAGANINYWQLNTEVLSPGISSRDLAIGGTSTASALFQVFGDTGNVTTDGTITAAPLNTPGGIIYAQSGGTLAVSAAGTVGQCLVSGGSGTPTWTSCSSAASNYWQNDGTTLSPSNTTWNLAVGGTSTASAKFMIDGLTGNATTSGNFVFGGTAATNVIAARNKEGITVGDAQTGGVTFNGDFVRINTLNTAGGIVYTDALGTLATSSQGTTGQCLLSGGSGTPTWQSCSVASNNYWQLNGEVLSPGNSTWDLAVGGSATSSALFKVEGTTGNATMAGTLTVSTIRPPTGPLTLQYKSGPNTWANGIVLQPTTGNVGIGNNNPIEKLDVTGNATVSGNLTLGNGSALQSAYGPVTINYKSGPNTWGAGITLAATTGYVGIGTTNPQAQLAVVNTSTTFPTNGIGQFDWSPTGAASTTGDVLSVNVGTNGTVGNIFNVKNNSSSVFSVGQNQIVANLPTAFTSPGDVSMAYDLQFTNPTASYIKSNAPLYIESGEIFESNDLTLRTYNAGNVVIDSQALTGRSASFSSQLMVGTNTFLPANMGALYVTNGATYGKALTILNQTENQDIFTASSSGTTRFVIGNTGTLTFNSYQSCTSLTTTAAGTVVCGTNAGANINYWQLNDEVISPGISSRDLAVGGTSTASALFQVFGDTGNVTTDGTITSTTLNTPGGIIYAQSGGTLGVSAAGTLGQCLVSGGSGTPSWTDCAVASNNYWQLNDNVLSPAISSYDLAIGGTATSSALFQVFGTTGDATMAGTLTVGTIQPPDGPLTLNYKSGPNSWAAALTIQPTTGYVGIGTTNPQARLDLGNATATITNSSGDITISAASGNVSLNSGNLTNFTQTLGSLGSVSLPTYSFAGDANTGMYSGGADNIRFTTGGVNRMTIDANGLVGIGTTAPTSLLHVNGGYSDNAAFIVNNLNSGDLMVASASGVTRFRVDNSGNIIASSFQDSANTAYFLDPANVGTSLTVAGRTGIGTATPEHMLQVTGAIPGKALTVFNETGDQNILVASSSGTAVFQIAHDGQVTIGTNTKPDVSVTLYGDIFQQANTGLTNTTGITDTFIYDTSKDSDYGAWTDSTTSRILSWYTETKDDGQNDPCVISTDDRCGTSAFPKKAIIVTDASNVYIYDALSNTLWMKFTQTGTFALGADTDNNPSSVYALNGSLFIGMNGASSVGVVEIDFKSDRMFTYDTTDRAQGDTSIANRNTTTSYATNAQTSMALLDAAVNDVHGVVINGKTFVAAATDEAISLIRKSELHTFHYNVTGDDDYNSVWVTASGNLYGLNETLKQVDKWERVDMDSGGQLAMQPEHTFGYEGIPALAASQPTFSTSAPDALYVAEGFSTDQSGKDIFYVGSNLGVSAIQESLNSNLTTGTFSTTSQAQLPVANSQSSMISTNIAGTRYFHLIGGRSAAPATVSTVYKATLNSSGDVGTFATTTQGQLPAVLSGQDTVTANVGGTQYAYTIGGSTNNTAATSVSTVYRSTIDASGDMGTFATTSQGQLPAVNWRPVSEIININGTNYIYSIGGQSAAGTVQSTVYKSTIDSSGNAGTFATTSQAQLPAVRQLVSMASTNMEGRHYIYVVGGHSGAAAVSTVYKGTINSSGNITSFTTTGQAQLPQIIYGTTSNIMKEGNDSYLYVSGGLNTGTAAAVSTVYRARISNNGDIGTFSTTSLAQLPALRHLGNAAVVNMGGQQYYYYVGGAATAGTPLSTVYKSTIDSPYGHAKYYTTDYITDYMIGDIRGMWTFNESSGSLQDKSVRNNWLEDEDAPTYSVSGARGMGLTFDGSADHLCSDSNNDGTCDNDADFDFAALSFSQSVWFKHGTSISANQVLLEHYYNTAGTAVSGWSVYMDATGRINFAVDDDSTLTPDDLITSPNAYNDGQWHHLVTVKERATSIHMYVDGVRVAVKDDIVSSGSLSGAAVVLSVGASCAASANCATGTLVWDGQIDEVMIAAELFTEDQIRTIYLSGRQSVNRRSISVTDATTFSSTTIGDSGEAWIPNEFVGSIVEIVGGTGVNQSRRVSSNTATTLTVSPAWTTTPSTDSDFQIKPQELYGATNTATAVTMSEDPASRKKYLYIGTNDGSDGGGVTALDYAADSAADVYHGDAGKTDEDGTAWDASANYDDIRALDAKAGVLAIGAQDLYWQEREARQFSNELDRLRDEIDALRENGGGGGVGNVNIGQESENPIALGQRQLVIRKGWGWNFPASAAVDTTGPIGYGITFDDDPIVVANYLGGINVASNLIDPTTFTECVGSGSFYSTAINHFPALVTKSDFRMTFALSSGTFNVTSGGPQDRLCYSWIAMGTSYQSASSSYPEWAAGADIAEYYATDDVTLQAGEVVGITTEGDIKVERTSKDTKSAALGIISTRPATILGDKSGLTPGYKEDEFSANAPAVAVALAGRVPVKVSLENGKVQAGDYLTPTSTPGYVAKAITAGPVVGKAMENFDGTVTISNIVTPQATESAIFTAPNADDPTLKELSQGRGIIMAFVQNGYWDPDSGFKAEDISKIYSLEKKTASQSGILSYVLRNTVIGQVIDKALSATHAIIANITAGAISAQEIATENLTIGGKKIEELIAIIVEKKLESGISIANISQKTTNGAENLMIQLGSPTSSASATNVLTIADRYANPVATIDELGNASFSGTLQAKQAKFESLSINDASVSGILYADHIAGLKERVAALVTDKLKSEPLASSSSELIASLTETNSEVLERIASLESRTFETASSSGFLASDAFENLAIEGTGSMDTLIAQSAITVGSTVLIDSTGISSAQTLSLQGNGMGSISFLAGAMTLDSQGLMVTTDAYFAKTVTIKEELMVDVIKSHNGDIALHLATPSGELSERLAILNNQTQEVASIDASGSAKFTKLIIASDKLDPSSTATIAGQYTTNASTGQSQIPAGTVSLKILSPKVSSDSLVYVTPTSSTNNQVLYVSKKHIADPLIPGDQSYFVVSLDNAIAIPVTFNWWIIN